MILAGPFGLPKKTVLANSKATHHGHLLAGYHGLWEVAMLSAQQGTGQVVTFPCYLRPYDRSIASPLCFTKQACCHALLAGLLRATAQVHGLGACWNLQCHGREVCWQSHRG